MAIQRLTAAYRSRSRPSSTPGAKASTMCPSYLDGDQALQGAPGDTRWLAAIVAIAASWHGCAVFKVRKEARAPDWGARSLKTQQHAPRRSAYGAVGRVRIGGPR